MRLIAAILVVSLHIPFPSIVGKMIPDIARISVPFFLICSAFFFTQLLLKPSKAIA